MALVLKQVLDEIVADVAALADAELLPSGTSPVLTLLQTPRDWEKLKQQMGTHVCWGDQFVEDEYLSTNERDAIAYLVHVIMIRKRTAKWETSVTRMATLQQTLQRHFNHKRRMSVVSDTGTNQIICRVRRGIPGPPRDIDWEDYDLRGISVVCWFLEPRLD